MQNTLARWFSRIFHPLVISPITLSWMIFLSTNSVQQTLQWAFLALVVVIFPVALWIAYNKYVGRYSSWSVSIRQHRHSLYAFGLGCLILLIIILYLGNGPQIAIACLYAASLAAAAAAVVNRFFTKVSLHSMALTGCAVALFLGHDPISSGFFLVAGFPVGWSRIYLGEHTFSQLLLGVVIGAVSVFIIFPLMVPPA